MMSFPIAILEIVADNTNQNGLTISEESISFYTEMLKTIGISEDEQQHVLQTCQLQFIHVIKPLILKAHQKGEIRVELNECFGTKQRKYEILYRYYSACSL